MNIIDMTNHNNKNYFSGVNGKKFITVHQTGNRNRGANSLNHSKFVNKGSKVTWHYTVDETCIIQHFSDNVRCWHCGDGKGNGNYNSIGIELCINKDGDYIGTINNGIKLIKYLMNKYQIPITNVVQHNYWSGKNCPELIRSGYMGINWKYILNNLDGVTVNNKPSEPVFNKESYITEIARDVIKGVYGNGNTRKNNIYNTVQKEVNQIIYKNTNSGTPISKLAIDVIKGDYGNGNTRKENLYKTIQKEVNMIL